MQAGNTAGVDLRLGELLHAINDGMVIADGEGRFVLVNDAQRRLTGLPSGTGEVLRDLADLARVYELAEPDGRVLPLAEWPLARAVSGEVVGPVTLRAGRRDDPAHARLLSFSAEPILDSQHKVSLAVLVVHDVTRDRELERSLRETEQRAAAIFESAPFGIVVTSLPDHRIESVNAAFLSLFECTREDVIGRTSIEAGLVSAAGRAQVEAERRLNGEVPEIEVTRTSKAGHELVLALTISPITLDGKRVLLTTMKDITRQRRDQRSLENSQAHYRAVFDQAAFGVAMVQSRTGRYLEVNSRLCELLGYTRDELLALDWRAVTDPVDLTPTTDALATSERSFQIEKRYRRKDGSMLWARLTVSPVTIPDEPFNSKMVLIEDITEQRRVAEDLRQSQKLDSLGQLAGGVAHDFNNLLTVILSYGDVVLRDLQSGVPASEADVVEITRAGRRAAQLTRRLLDFARRQMNEPAVLDLAAVVLECQKLLVRLVGEDVVMNVSLAPGLWPIWADRGQLEQVVMNLAVNARDAMPGGGALTFTTANVTFPPTHDTPGDWVRLSVRDSGTGMTPEVKAHLFEPFFTTKEQGRGTGLGLATVYGIVASAGGRVQAHSEFGRGSTFELLFPRTERVAGFDPVASGLHSHGGSEAVLVVEDDAQVREVTVRALRSGGYEVFVATQADQALAMPEATLARLELLVTDVVMPGLSGRQLADQLRAKYPRLKVLMVSGYPRGEMIDRGVLDPHVQFLAKPFMARSLLERVRNLLDAPRVAAV
jgi:PAS domain S-box-containing protein